MKYLSKYGKETVIEFIIQNHLDADRICGESGLDELEEIFIEVADNYPNNFTIFGSESRSGNMETLELTHKHIIEDSEDHQFKGWFSNLFGKWIGKLL